MTATARGAPPTAPRTPRSSWCSRSSDALARAYDVGGAVRLIVVRVVECAELSQYLFLGRGGRFGLARCARLGTACTEEDDLLGQAESDVGRHQEKEDGGPLEARIQGGG